jgi:hypothetical protein
MAHAQVLFVQRLWPGAVAQLDPLIAQGQPEPHWAVDALLLRSRARAQLGQGTAAASDARQAFLEAQRLQDGTAESWRTQAARAAQDRIGRAEP